MKRVSIRLKLTAWYFAILLASLSIFGAAAFIAMSKGIEKSVDENLEGQADGIEEVMGHVLQEEPARLQDELREHQELREQADFLQVCDQNGRWIYRSRLMTSHEVPVPAKASYSAYNVMSVDLPLRVLVREMKAGADTYRIQVAAPMDDFYDAIDRFKWMVLLLSPLVLALASAGGYWLSRRALAPVDQITRAAQDINSNNLAKRLDVPQNGDELQRLSETLNSMLGRLESSFNRITQFTGDASHELRTPLALMRTTTEVSLRTSQTVADYREAQQEVLSELEKTSSLVEKLMLLARTDAGVETKAREKVLSKSYYPRFNLQGSFSGRGSGANPDGTFGTGTDGLDLMRHNWAVGLTATFSVLDFPALHFKKQIEQSNERAQQAEYDTTLQNLTAQAERAKAAYDSAVLISQNTPVEMEAARLGERQANARYQSALAPIVELAEAQRLLLQAETDDNLARLTVWRAMLGEALAQGDLQPFLELARKRAAGGQ